MLSGLHLPWLLWGLTETLSQEGRSQSWWEWTRSSWVTWTCRWGLRLPISKTSRAECFGVSAVFVPLLSNGEPRESTSTVALEMSSCLYCVPYHSSVLSVCPSNDFETTATLEANEEETGQFLKQGTRAWARQSFSNSKQSTTEAFASAIRTAAQTDFALTKTALLQKKNTLRFYILQH